jgi:hypothetical protein
VRDTLFKATPLRDQRQILRDHSAVGVARAAAVTDRPATFLP